MHNYYKFMLNTSIMSFLHDLHVTFVWKPVPVFPIVGAYSAGWLSKFDSFVVLTVLIAFYLCSMIAGFVYRIVSLMDRSIYDWFLSRWGFLLIFGFHVIPACVVGFLLYKSYVPLEMIRTKALSIYPQLREIFDNQPVFVYDMDLNPILLYFCIVVVALILIALTTIEAFCIGFSFWQLRRAKRRLSMRAYKLHINLCVALAVQMLLPMFMIMYPCIFIALATLYGLRNLTFCAEIALVVCTMHSILDSLVIILLIRPYRLAILGVFTRRSNKIFQPVSSSIAFMTRGANTLNAESLKTRAPTSQ
ncbi:hypothetical protein M3Y97_00541400 [Aphelenchoides bicaudatus]|nr:hypothetical protein M3Y97_00541400 [Aphelenchoides bicaudatus]